MKNKLTCANCKHNPMGVCELADREIPESYVIRRNKLPVWCPLKKGKK